MTHIESFTESMELLDAIDELINVQVVNQFQVSWDFENNCWLLSFPETNLLIDFTPEDDNED